MQNQNVSTKCFIEIIKRYKPIYDTTSADYKNMEKKLKCWQKVSNEAGLPLDVCKRKWKNLRDSYTKCLRSFRYESANRKYQYWAHAEQMEFLRPYQGSMRNLKGEEVNIELKKYLNNTDVSPFANTNDRVINIKPEVKNEPYQEECIISDPALQEEFSLQQPSNNEFLNYIDQNNPLEIESNKFINTNHNYQNDNNNNNMPKSNLQITNIRSTKLAKKNKLLSKNSSITALKLISELDATSLFFLSLAKSVNSMPKSYQSNIKMQCMKIIVDAEAELETTGMFNNVQQQEELNIVQQEANANGEQFLYVMSPKTLIDISSEDE